MVVNAQTPSGWLRYMWVSELHINMQPNLDREFMISQFQLGHNATKKKISCES